MLAGELGDSLSYPILVSLLNNFLMIFTEPYNILSLQRSVSNWTDAMDLFASSLNLLQQFIRLFLLTFGPYYLERKACYHKQSIFNRYRSGMMMNVSSCAKQAGNLYNGLLEERKKTDLGRKSDRDEVLAFMRDHPISICLSGYLRLDRSILIPVSFLRVSGTKISMEFVDCWEELCSAICFRFAQDAERRGDLHGHSHPV